MLLLTIPMSTDIKLIICKNIFACLFIVYHTIGLSCHEQVRLMRLHFERSISRNVGSLIKLLNILVHDMINLLYDKTY